jgi:hypothetical protein
MGAAVGDRIIVDSNKVGQKPREGVILEVIDTAASSHYRVEWDDGVETTLWPSGSVRTVHQEKKPARRRATT